jgi:N-succinyldiaminopimelate aminotransferase
MSLSPVLAEMATYPFVRLDVAKGEARARGIELIDFGLGDPREETDPMIRRALVDALEPVSSYPRATGVPELREAIADWCRRRFGAELDPEQEIVPTLGSKEAIFSFAQVVVDPRSDRRLVVAPEPGYPVYERGAAFAGAEARFVPLLEENRFLPDLDSFDDWEHVAVFWLNYPNNPTGATAPLELYERLAALATEYGFYVASDEAYSELWFDEPPASALQVAQRERVVVFNTLSKRSSMTGYRSGFVAAAPHLADALRKFRPTVGTAPQEFVQRASVVAWGDEQHVERTRQLYRRKREALVPALVAAGLRIAASEATFYLWVEAPGGDSEAFAEELMQRGIVVAPGSYFGAAGEGYVRFALVPSQAECERAAEVIRAL